MKKINISIVFLAILFTLPAYTQYFEQNKVRYRKFDFKVVKSKTFETYHYLKSDSLIIGFVRDAEKWRKRHSYIFKDTFDYKVPIILYNNHADFQQTSVVGGLIGTSTGGVTEALKNRVTLPLTPSFTQTDHVLGHELVHAHQYNMIKSADSLSFNNLANIPLWMTEGLAEYLSIGSVDEHTAMWMRDAVAYKYFPDIKDLNEARYFPYRFGHYFWAFTGGTFGDDIIKPLYEETARYGVKEAFKRILHLPIDSFSVRWKTTTENFYKPLMANRQLEGVGKNLVNIKNGGRLNISPSISPDGKYFIFFSEKDLFSIDLFLADAQSGKIIRKLSTRTRDSHLDDIDGFESAGTWSPDSKKYAFSAFSEGRKKVVITEVLSNKVVDEFFIENVPSFDNINWSPDGKKLLFTGLIDGQSDLYYLDLDTKKVTQLTNDYFAQIQGNWSNDSSKIVFATDKTNADSTVPSHDLSIAEMDILTKEINFLKLFAQSNNLNPIYTPDGKGLYFLSDREGFRDLYHYDFQTQKISQLTTFVTGISGITQYAPAVSVAKNNDIIYSLYQDSNYNIFKTNRAELNSDKEILVNDVNHLAATLPSMNLAETFVDNLLQDQEPLREALRMTQEPYRPKFKLDYISNGGIGVSTGRYGTGMAGGVNMLFGDILNNHQMYIGAVLNGELQDFGGQVAYLNSASRLGWGGALSHIPMRFYDYNLGYENITLNNGSNYNSLVETLYIYRMFQDQAGFFTFFPFSKINRIEASTSSSYYSFRLDKYKYYYEQNGYYLLGYEQERNLDAGESFFVQDVGLAYVGDDSSFGLTAPMNGYRYRLEVQQSFGKLNYTTLSTDLRGYYYAKPVAFAARLMPFLRVGNDSGNSILPPLYLGYETLVRGYTYKAFNNANTLQDNTLTQNDLLGSKMIIGSAEVRLPFTGPERLAAIKSGILFTDLNLFFDAGMAWGKNEYYNVDRSFKDSKIISSTGLSLRVNVFGQLIVEPYYAIPLQLNSGGVFGINFTPGW